MAIRIDVPRGCRPYTHSGNCSVSSVVVKRSLLIKLPVFPPSFCSLGECFGFFTEKVEAILVFPLMLCLLTC